MSEQIGVLGAGNQAIETTGYLEMEGYKVAFYYQESGFEAANELIAPVISDWKMSEPVPLLITAVGSPKLRNKLVEHISADEIEYVNLCSKATILPDVTFGDDVTICPGAIINRFVDIGNHVLLNVGAIVSHHNKVGDYVTIGPNVSLAGHVTIGDGTFVGIGSTVLEDIKVGSGCIVAAGAVVVEDIPDNTLVAGVPAKVKKKLTEWY